MEVDKMKFRKLDDNTVRCVLSKEDMEERGLKLEDFFTDKDKTRGFLEEIVRQAQEEVGYETSGDTLAMQVMPLPHNGLAITFSEHAEHSIKDMIGHIRSALEDVNSEELDNMITPLYEDEKQQVKKKEKSASNKPKKKKKFFRVYRFENMNLVEDFCKTIPKEFIVKSQLYKDETEQQYYLTIEKGRLSTKNLENICLRAPEFATLISNQEGYIVYCKEHFHCLIKKGAVKVMRKLAM